MKKKIKYFLASLVAIVFLATMTPFIMGVAYTVAVAFGLASVVDHSFEEQKQKAISETYELLDQSGVCLPERTCRGKRLFTVAVIDKGLSVIVYGIQDQILLSHISKAFMDKYYATLEMKYLAVMGYPFSEDDRGFLNCKTWFVSPIFHIEMRR